MVNYVQNPRDVKHFLIHDDNFSTNDVQGPIFPGNNFTFRKGRPQKWWRDKANCFITII